MTEKSVTDYPLQEVQVIWSLDNPELAAVKPCAKLMRIGDRDDPDYLSSWGACNADFNGASEPERLFMLFRQFAHMTITEGVDPKELHEVFMAIPEWRTALQEIGTIEPDPD